MSDETEWRNVNFRLIKSASLKTEEDERKWMDRPSFFYFFFKDVAESITNPKQKVKNKLELNLLSETKSSVGSLPG